MEKVTLDDVIEETLLICDVSGVGQVKSMDPDLRKLYSVFLKQIRNEIYEDYDETQSIYSVQKVFNKYLKEN